MNPLSIFANTKRSFFSCSPTLRNSRSTGSWSCSPAREAARQPTSISKRRLTAQYPLGWIRCSDVSFIRAAQIVSRKAEHERNWNQHDDQRAERPEFPDRKKCERDEARADGDGESEVRSRQRLRRR